MAFGDEATAMHSTLGEVSVLATVKNRQMRQIRQRRPVIKEFYTNQRTGNLHAIFDTSKKEGYEHDVVFTDELKYLFKKEYEEYLEKERLEGGIFPLSDIGLDPHTIRHLQTWGVMTCNTLAKMTDDDIAVKVRGPHDHDVSEADKPFYEKCIGWRDQCLELISAGGTEDSPTPTPRKKARAQVAA